MIREVMAEKPRSCTVTWLARQLNCCRENVYDIYRRPNIDVETASIERQKAKVVKPDMLLDEVEPMVAEMLGKELSRSSVAAASSTGSTKKEVVKDAEEASSFDNPNYPGVPQQKTLPANALVGAAFYLENGKPVVMLPAKSQGSKSKIGYKVAVKIVYEDANSKYRFTTGTPELYVLLGKSADIRDMKMVKLETSKDDRKYKFAVASAFGVKLCKDFIDCTFVDKGDGVYMMKPLKPLKKGSYGIYYQVGNQDPVMYDFDVN